MSTPKPHLAAPPIPATLELDDHSRPFFFPDEHCGPVDARFRLDIPAFKDRVFVGRIARFCTGALHLVARKFSGDAAADAQTPLLVSALAVFATSDPQRRARLTRSYLTRYLDYPPPSTHSTWQSRVPVLRDPELRAGFTRLHMDTVSGLGLQFRGDGCGLVDWRPRAARCREGRLRDAAVSAAIELGDAIFRWEAPADAMRAFASMGEDDFHNRAEELLRDDSCALPHTVRFHLMSFGERICRVFGCDGQTHRAAREMLWMALSLELGVGGALASWTRATWHPWAPEELVEGRGADGERVCAEVPQSLAVWLDVVGKATGCTVRGEIASDVEGLFEFERTFARAYAVSAQEMSAHERIEAAIKLREMVEGKAEGERE